MHTLTTETLVAQYLVLLGCINFPLNFFFLLLYILLRIAILVVAATSMMKPSMQLKIGTAIAGSLSMLPSGSGFVMVAVGVAVLDIIVELSKSSLGMMAIGAWI